MGSIPYALSIHHYITTVGSDAGFAALIGLAILVLLYFAHARETSSLREQVAESAERVQQLEARLARQGGTETPAAAPVAAAPMTAAPRSSPLAVPASSAAAPETGSTVVVAEPVAPAAVTAARLEPAAPAGVAAPPLAAATRLIPSAVLAAGNSPRTSPATAAGTAVRENSIEDTAFVSAAAVGANGAGTESTTGVGNHRAATPPPRVALRSGAAGAASSRPTATRLAVGPPPPKGAPPKGSRRGRRGLLAVLVALLVAGVVVALILITSSGSGGSPTAASQHPASNAPVARRKSQPVAFNPRSVKVAVLNGTATAGLAARIAVKLDGHGYNVATTTNAADQTRTVTVVAYTPGKRTAGLAVAKSLGLGPASVQPIDQSTEAIACPPPAPCSNMVVVTAGADVASSA